LYILFDFLHCSQREFLFLIDRAKKTLVPGAVACYAQKEAPCLIGWSDGTLLKT
jgi:hypothetical protein